MHYTCPLLTISQTHFNNEPECSGDLTILIMPSIPSLDIISVAVPEPKICLHIPTSVADAVAVNLNGIKTLLANGLITFLLMVTLFLTMDQEVFQEILLVVSS